MHIHIYIYMCIYRERERLNPLLKKARAPVGAADAHEDANVRAVLRNIVLFYIMCMFYVHVSVCVTYVYVCVCLLVCLICVLCS